MTEEVTLAPCPKCGCDKADTEIHRKYWFVECMRCEYFSDANYTEAEAIAAWNARANQPPAQDGLEAEIERLEGLVQTYRGAQLRAEEKLCRERANAQGWKVRAEMLASKLDALASLGDKP